MYRPLPLASLPMRFLGLAYAERLTAASGFLRYTLAATFFLIALFARFELTNFLPPKGFPFLTFFPAVLLAAYLTGLGPGLLTSALSVWAAWFFFVQPDRSLVLTGPDLVALVFFSAILLIDCLVIHVMKTALVRVHRTEQQLRESTHRLGLVLDNLYMYVGLLDLDGTVHGVNEEPLRVASISRNEILGSRLWDAPWWADNIERQNEVRSAVARAAAGETVRFDIEVERSAKKYTVDFQVGPMRDSEGNVTALVASGVNVSARTDAMAALQSSRHEAIIAAEAAEAERRVLDATLNAVPASIIVADANGKLLRMNRAVEQIWGVAPFSKDVAGYDEWKGWWADGSVRHGQKIQPHEWGLARSLHGQTCNDIIEVEPFGRPGERLITLLSAAPVVDPSGQVVGGVVAQVDITARIHAENALRESEGRFRALFDWGPIAIFSCDASGMFQEYNRCAVQLWGREPKRLDSGERYSGAHKLYRSDDTLLSPLQSPMAEVLRGDIPAVHDEELVIERPDGSKITVIVHVVPLKNEQGKITSAVCCFVDITERSRLERKNQDMAQSLTDLDRRKDEFLAMLSHELRNPLAALFNAAHLLRLQTDEAPLQLQARAIIERQVGQLKNLVDDLLEVSRISTGRVQLRREEVAVSGVVERALETAQPLITQHRHELTVAMPSEPIWLHADTSRLEQVLVNLLTNAAKYTEDGGRIWLSVEQELDILVPSVVIKVCDSGIGIAPDLLPHIFDLFTQADRSLHRSEGGLGIGLNLVQRLVELHGGTVTADSVMGQGSEFSVRLPLTVRPVDELPLVASTAPSAHQEPQEAQESKAHEPPTLPEGSGCRVLLVDDNVDSAQTLALLLEMNGHTVQLAYDGLSAVEAAIAYRPDVVLLDIGLPGLDGYQTAQRIREEASLKNVVLIALTGYGRDKDRERSKQVGFDHHLVKPAKFNQIDAILRTVSAAKRLPT